MIEKLFTRKITINAPVRTVFAWHATEGAINRLTPPWAPVSLVARKGEGIDKGVEMTFKIKLFGIPMTWKARHIDYKEDEMFMDCQVKGPFASWEHTHLFHEKLTDSMVMEDQVRFRLPFGIFSLPFYGFALGTLINRDEDPMADLDRTIIGRPPIGLSKKMPPQL